MSCSTSPTDIKDYLLGEISPSQVSLLEKHFQQCGNCRSELEQLQLTQSLLAGLPTEEPPQRIAFVSDKVFKPRWWERVWQSGPAMGFASALVLAAAIFAHGHNGTASMVPVAAVPVQNVSSAEIDARVQKRLDSFARQQQVETVALIQAAESRLIEQHDAELKEVRFQHAAEITTMREQFDYFKKKRGVYTIANNQLGQDSQ